MACLEGMSSYSQKDVYQYDDQYQEFSPCQQQSLFIVNRIDKIIRGYSPCALFQGKLRASQTGTSHQQFSILQADSEALSCATAPMCTATQDLNLYISYELASPRLNRPIRAETAPYRFHIRDRNDEMLACSKSLATELVLDEVLLLAYWGPDLAIAFPTLHDLHHFVSCLRNVHLRCDSLAGTPAALLLPQYEQNLCIITPGASTITSNSTAPPPQYDNNNKLGSVAEEEDEDDSSEVHCLPKI